MAELTLSKRESVDVDLDWMGGKRSEAKMRGFTVLIDNPEVSGGEDANPKPTELFLISLGGCLMIDFLQFAEELTMALKGVHLKISGLREKGINPRFTKISGAIYPKWR